MCIRDRYKSSPSFTKAPSSKQHFWTMPSTRERTSATRSEEMRAGSSCVMTTSSVSNVSVPTSRGLFRMGSPAPSAFSSDGVQPVSSIKATANTVAGADAHALACRWNRDRSDGRLGGEFLMAVKYRFVRKSGMTLILPCW